MMRKLCFEANFFLFFTHHLVFVFRDVVGREELKLLGRLAEAVHDFEYSHDG